MNKREFLDAICGKPVERIIDGLVVEIRSLTVMEMEQIHNKSEGTNEIDAALLTVVYGLVTPKLEESDLVYLKQGKPGTLMKIAKEISQLSGLTGEDDSPTVGNG